MRFFDGLTDPQIKTSGKQKPLHFCYFVLAVSYWRSTSPSLRHSQWLAPEQPWPILVPKCLSLSRWTNCFTKYASTRIKRRQAPILGESWPTGAKNNLLISSKKSPSVKSRTSMRISITCSNNLPTRPPLRKLPVFLLPLTRAPVFLRLQPVFMQAHHHHKVSKCVFFFYLLVL